MDKKTVLVAVLSAVAVLLLWQYKADQESVWREIEHIKRGYQRIPPPRPYPSIS